MGAIFLLGREGGGGRCGKAPQASQARPALRARAPLSLRDISPRSGESPFDKGAFFCAGEAREGSLPSQGRWPSGSDGRRGFGGLRQR